MAFFEGESVIPKIIGENVRTVEENGVLAYAKESIVAFRSVGTRRRRAVQYERFHGKEDHGGRILELRSEEGRGAFP